MKTKKYLIASFVFILGGVASLSAQTTLSGDHIITGDLGVGDGSTKGNLSVTGETGNAAAPGVSVAGDGGVLFTGNFGTGQIPMTGAGVRFMWYPKKGAIRAGDDGGYGSWDDGSIGYYSAAFGWRSTASGQNSIAAGFGHASGLGASAFSGGQATATQSFGGAGHSHAENAVGLSGGYAWATYSTVMSIGSANGYCSVGGALGVTYGAYSFAMSDGDSYGAYSTALSGSGAVGDYSVSMGYGAAAISAHSVVIGRNNTLEGNPTTWVETDPLFLVGNGTGNPTDDPEVQNRNALAVYKNGDVRIPKRQGDILMGEFGE